MARWLNNTTIHAWDAERVRRRPAICGRRIENGYDESLATIKGRFWYVQLKKRF
jgi:hypothetical protein